MRTRSSYVVSMLVLVCIFVLTMGNQSAQANVREEFGLVSLWTFDEDTINGNEVDDAFGENNGTIEGNAKSVQGAIGNALSFDGVVDLVRITPGHLRNGHTHLPGLSRRDLSAETSADPGPRIERDSFSHGKGHRGFQARRSGDPGGKHRLRKVPAVPHRRVGPVSGR